jgi:Tfp pilus assembly protein FimV
MSETASSQGSTDPHGRRVRRPAESLSHTRRRAGLARTDLARLLLDTGATERARELLDEAVASRDPEVVQLAGDRLGNL